LEPGIVASTETLRRAAAIACVLAGVLVAATAYSAPVPRGATPITTVQTGRYAAVVYHVDEVGAIKVRQRVTLDLVQGRRHLARLRLPEDVITGHEFKLERIDTGGNAVLRFSASPIGDDADLLGRDSFQAWFVAGGGHSLIWSGTVNALEPGARIELADLNADGRKEVVLGEFDAQVLFCGRSRARLFPRIWDFKKRSFVPAPFEPRLPPDTELVTARLDDDAPSSSHFGDIVRFRSASSDLRDSRQGLTTRVSLPTALGDGQPSTAWIEGVAGPGRGQFVTADTSHAFPMRGLRIFPGHGANDKAYAVHGRPSRVLLAFSGGETIAATLPSTPRRRLAEGAALYIEFPRPLRTRCVTILILEVEGGQKGPGTAISEIRPLFEPDFLPRKEAVRTVVQTLIVEKDRRRRADLIRVAKTVGPEALPAVREAFDAELSRDDRLPRLEPLIPLLAALPPEGLRGIATKLLAHPQLSAADLARLQRTISLDRPAYADALLTLALDESAPDLSRTRAVQIVGRAAPADKVIALAPLLGRGDRLFRSRVVRGVSRAPFSVSQTLLDIASNEPGSTACDDALWALDRVVRRHLRGVFKDLTGAEQILSIYNNTDDLRVRMRALRLLNRVRAPGGDVFLVTVLESKEREEVRELAAIALKHYDSDVATDALLRTLHDESPTLRIAAVSSLQSRPNLPRVIRDVRDYTRRESWKRGRAAGYRLLADSDLRDGADYLYELIDGADDVRAYDAIVAILGARHHVRPLALDPVITGTKRPVRMRLKAVQALAFATDPDSELLLTRILKGEAEVDEALRPAAARGLGRRRSEAGLTSLVDTVTDPRDPNLQRACIRSLGFYTDDRALRVLVGLRSKVDLRTRKVLEDSIDNITDRLESKRRK
jgi:HEAT repeat protein